SACTRRGPCPRSSSARAAAFGRELGAQDAGDRLLADGAVEPEADFVFMVETHDRLNRRRRLDHRDLDGHRDTVVRHFRHSSSVRRLTSSVPPSAFPGSLVASVAGPPRLPTSRLGALGPAVDVAPVAGPADHDEGVATATVELPG